MEAARIRALLLPLVKRAGLVRGRPVGVKIHEDAKITAMEMTGCWGSLAPRSDDWRSRLIPEARSVDESSSRGVCALCFQVSEGKADLPAVYRRKGFILSHITGFNVDEVLLLCHTLASHVAPYALWFRANCGDLTALLMTCHRRLMEDVARMSAEQLQSCLVLCEALGARYPVFGLEHAPLRREALKRLSVLSGTTEVASLRRMPLKQGESEQAVDELPSRVQRAYSAVYPYFEAVHSRLKGSRSHTFHLVEAAASVQRQHSALCEASVSDFVALCLALKQGLSKAEAFSLQGLINLVVLLHGNQVVSPDAPRLEADEVRVLARRLQELAIDSYLVLPSADGEDVLPEAVERCVTKLFSVCLESPDLSSLVRCLVALSEAGLLNGHLATLFVPYVANSVSRRDCRPGDLLQLVPPVAARGLSWLPFWAVHLSVLEGSRVTKANLDMEAMLRLCETLSACLSRMLAELSETPPAALSESGSDEWLKYTAREYHSTQARWVWHLDETRLVNVTDVDDLEGTASLSKLLEKRFGVRRHPRGITGGLVETLRKLHTFVGDAMRRAAATEDSTHSTAQGKRCRVKGAFRTAKRELEAPKPANSATDSHRALGKVHELLGLRIDMLEQAGDSNSRGGCSRGEDAAGDELRHLAGQPGRELQTMRERTRTYPEGEAVGEAVLRDVALPKRSEVSVQTYAAAAVHLRSLPVEVGKHNVGRGVGVRRRNLQTVRGRRSDPR
ncbi:excinuclease ABC subunit C [Babesia caballi]|uniref:Excinuclease ABC subunit C n=1 Tax=Babesia caballi TaxID=5871 RepID=A0AAV4LVT4_BABCB|nr:excinuclease ABC subunit C [Babesia caballi]